MKGTIRLVSNYHGAIQSNKHAHRQQTATNMSAPDAALIQTFLVATNKKDESERVLRDLDNVSFSKNEEELVVKALGAGCTVRFQVRGAVIDHAASRYRECHDKPYPWETNFFVSTWEGSRKDVAAAVLKIKEGRTVELIVSTREETITCLCFTPYHSS